MGFRAAAEKLKEQTARRKMDLLNIEEAISKEADLARAEIESGLDPSLFFHLYRWYPGHGVMMYAPKIQPNHIANVAVHTKEDYYLVSLARKVQNNEMSEKDVDEDCRIIVQLQDERTGNPLGYELHKFTELETILKRLQ